MDRKITLYVSNKNVLTWLSALCMIGSAVARILIVGTKGADVWSQIVLPVFACVLFALMVLETGKEFFYKTAIPVWLIAIYFFFVFEAVDFQYMDTMITILYAITLIFVAAMYTQITSEKTNFMWLLVPVLMIPIGAIAYLHRSALLAMEYGGLFTGALSYDFLGNYKAMLPDALMTLGLLLIIFAAKPHPVGQWHPTWGEIGRAHV